MEVNLKVICQKSTQNRIRVLALFCTNSVLFRYLRYIPREAFIVKSLREAALIGIFSIISSYLKIEKIVKNVFCEPNYAVKGYMEKHQVISKSVLAAFLI